jgi:hypothetical protein
MNEVKLQAALRLLDQAINESPKPPHVIKLDEYYTIVLTQGGSLKLYPTRKSYDADLHIKREIGRDGRQTLTSVEVVRRTKC